MDRDRTFLATVVATVVLLGLGLGAGVYLGETGAFDGQPRVDPSVSGVFVSNTTCVADPVANATVSAGNTSRGSFLSLTADLPLRDGATPPTNATIEQAGLANYTLAIESRSDGDPPACAAGETPVATVRVDFEVPHPGEEPFGVTVTYRDDALFRVRNSPEGLRVVNTADD
jgi:hypothetical protein